MRALLVLLLLASLTLPQASAHQLEARPARSSATSAPLTPVRLYLIPDRLAGALGGTAFARGLIGLSRADREAAIVAEVLRGNIPPFLRHLRPVSLRGRIGGRQVTATIWAMPDYLAVGSDDDFVRVPVDFHSAAKIARAFGMALPTRKIVDAIYAQAALHLKPQPMPPGPRMTSANYFLVHNQTIETQRAHRALGALIAGQKKDLVVTNRLVRQRSPRVAIYGWHRGAGDPIQPLSTVHGATYADYSHGLRLLGGVMVIDGIEHRVIEAMTDPRFAGVLSVEGTIHFPAELLPEAASPATTH